MRTFQRRDLLKAAGGVAGLALMPRLSPAVGPETGSKPNIILLLTDDQGYGDLGATGNPKIKTPNLDAMYKAGLRFTDFHVSPTCSPTRCSIMTGRHEFKSGVTHTILERERMSLKATTAAQILKSAGYTTGIFGKWHLGDEADHQPNQRGFDEVYIHGAGGIGQTYPGSCGDAPGNKYTNPTLLHNGTFEKTQGFCTDLFFAQAEKWIESVKGKQPFFAYIPTNAAHGPLSCPEQYEKMYAGSGLPDNVVKFFGMLTNIDDNLGQLLEKLKGWGIDKNTLVIAINDNGGTAGCKVYNAGMRGTKGSAYNGGTRAFSIWYWPGTIKPDVDCDRLSAHIDLFPTFADLSGAKVPDDVAAKLDGRSLLSLLKDPNAPWADRFLFTHVGRWAKGSPPEKYSKCSVRNTQYLLVSEGKGNQKKWELFDLKADPGEKNDVAARHPDVVKTLDEAYDKWWAEVVPCMENEDAVGPKVNPFKELYWKQFGGGPAEGEEAPTRKDRKKKSR